MKNCDEMVNSLLERREQYAAEQKRRRTVFVRTATSMCCVCLMALLCLGIMQKGGSNILPERTMVSDTRPGIGTPLEGIKGDSTNPPAINESANDPSASDTINIQKIEKLPDNSVEMNIALMLDDFIRMSNDEIKEYYGANIFPVVPNDLKSKEDQFFGIFKRKSTGETYWDTNKISYSNEDSSRTVNVNVDKDCVPFDFLDLFDDVETRSMISNVEVGIAQTPYGDFYAEFMLEGVGFRVVSSGLAQEELVSIISSLIK